MEQIIFSEIKKTAKELFERGFIRSGYIAAKSEDGIVITKPNTEFANVTEEMAVFVNDKNIESLDGNFRAAAVILFCAIRQDKKVGAAAIVDSDNILKFSSKRKTIKPILDDMTQINGITVKCASANTAAEVVSALSGMRNSCFLPDAGAVVTGRDLKEVANAVLVLDKAAHAELLAENKGGTEPIPIFFSIIEHTVFKLKYSKLDQKSKKKEAAGEERKSAITTPELAKIAQDIKDAGVKLLEENLVQGTWGNISVRVDDTYMLATPSGLDYVDLKPEQMAKVNIETLEWEGSDKPTSEKGIHSALLKGDKSCNAVVHTHPHYGCIIAAIGKDLPVPEKYQSILGKTVKCAKYGTPSTQKLVNNTVEAIGDGCACILKNHGAFVRGKDLDTAFEIYRALEDACRDYLLNA
jgi:L-ribulose-5-phosphate 4-epimerase